MAKSTVRQGKQNQKPSAEAPVTEEIRRAAERIGRSPDDAANANLRRALGRPEWDLQVLELCFEAKFQHALKAGGSVEVDASEFDLFHSFVNSVRERVRMRHDLDRLEPSAAAEGGAS